ncbi:hypothetical protein Dsin_018785 [Dipteronia sinensis]|uniref:Mediator of RNA polymerase II transcription subunit 10 n=1 Tax=Dipteronia sinensis TaxID=43782 RepID=A0AAE0A6T5_9ROSI|nr:hypothetical protein Dsin_018785 [Dipteronia sinensis]
MESSQNAMGRNGGNGMVSNQTSAADPKQNLNQTIKSVQKTLGLLHQLYLTVSSFNSASQLPLLQRLNSLVTELDNMVKLSEKCDIQVPVEVLNLIDEGKNPDEFTRDVINSCIAKNQVTKGRTDAFKSFRKHHLEELERTFPDEVESYREIRASSVAVCYIKLANLHLLGPMFCVKFSQRTEFFHFFCYFSCSLGSWKYIRAAAYIGVVLYFETNRSDVHNLNNRIQKQCILIFKVNECTKVKCGIRNVLHYQSCSVFFHCIHYTVN